MNRYRIYFQGRKDGALGIFYQMEMIISAYNRNHAEQLFWAQNETMHLYEVNGITRIVELQYET